MPLALLVAGPILDLCNRAHAGYISSDALASPSLSPASAGSCDELATDHDEQRDGKPVVLFPGQPSALRLNPDASAPGAGAQSPPSGFGPAGSGQTPATASSLQLDAPLLAGVLFL